MLKLWNQYLGVMNPFITLSIFAPCYFVAAPCCSKFCDITIVFKYKILFNQALCGRKFSQIKFSMFFFPKRGTLTSFKRLDCRFEVLLLLS